MTELSRKPPNLAPNYGREDVRDAVHTLRDRPAIPRKTPSGTSADGYADEICHDASYVYIYCTGVGWKRAALSTF